MKKIIIIFIVLCITPIFLFTIDWLNNNPYELDKKTYIVVYWNKVELNGEPSKRLKARLDTGYSVFSEWWEKIIVSWGIGIEWFDEADVMKKYLINKGVEERDIIVDSNGYTTRKTSDNTWSIITALEEDIDDISVVWVSQFYHISRVKLSLRQAWFGNVYGLAPKYFEVRDFYSLLREVPAYLKYVFWK